MPCFILFPKITMAATQNDNEFGTFLAFSPTAASVARSFGYVLAVLQLPSPSLSLSHLSDTPSHLRKISPLVLDWRRSHCSSKDGMQPSKELHLLSHCCRQHLRRLLTSDEGRDRCLVTEHPLHWCDGCWFILSITVTTLPQQLGMTSRRVAQLIGATGVGLSVPSPTTPRRGHAQAAILRPIKRVHVLHEFATHPPPGNQIAHRLHGMREQEEPMSLLYKNKFV